MHSFLPENRIFHVTGIGNAIVDVLSHCDESFIAAQKLQKGAMTLIDASQAEELYAKMGPAAQCSGGSVANTLAGMAQLGSKTAFIGKVRDDQLGKIFKHDMQSLGIDFPTPASLKGKPTARCLVCITPDGERTMNTYIGACDEISPEDIEGNLIKTAQILLIEGYLWDQEAAKQAIRQAVELARISGTKVAFSLSDVFCVERHREEFKSLIRDYVDILFCNEGELESLAQTGELEKNIHAVRGQSAITCVTRGDRGSIILTSEERYEISPAALRGRVVDTTGAGDLYAAGVLFGLSSGASLQRAGELGSACAAEIIQQLGARSSQSLNLLVA